MVQQLYAGAIAPAAGRVASALSPIFYYPWYRTLRKRALPYLSNGVQTAAEKLSSLSNQVLERDMVTYWKDFIRGIPDYAALVRAKKFQEIENVLTTLARQNEIFRLHEERIHQIQKALKELQDEARKP
jgi:hypothetical protein